ncbi:MAG: hypothetical protein HY585_02755 [Candidatus Omnitrophica bacterium]|nr:hypothetical protein [Candidatus Omnitrophota bacterium]
MAMKHQNARKHGLRTSIFLIAMTILFWFAVSNPAQAGKIIQGQDGTGWEYGEDAQGRPTTTIHYRKDPYEWSIHKGGKEVRTYDPKTGGIIHNEFFNDEGVRQWEEAIDPETGDTTATRYFDLDGNPKVTTSTSNNYWVKEAALKRRGEYTEGWLDQFTKDEGTLSDGFNEWAENIDKGVQDLANQWKDFISGGSLGITNKTKDAPARTEPSEPEYDPLDFTPDAPSTPAQPKTPEPKRPETGNWDFLPQYDPLDMTPGPNSSSQAAPVPDSAPTFANFLGSFNEPTPQEIDYNKYGDSLGFDPQRGITFVTNSATKEITYFYHRQDNQFQDPRGGTYVVTMLNGKVVHEDNYDHLGELMAPVPSDSRPTNAGQNLTPAEAGASYFTFGDSGGDADSSSPSALSVSSTYHTDTDASISLKMKLTYLPDSSENTASGPDFSSFDALQQGGFGTLSTTPTAAFDTAPQSRDMETGIPGGASTPSDALPKTDCDH